jgi:hypothetical protein
VEEEKKQQRPKIKYKELYLNVKQQLEQLKINNQTKVDRFTKAEFHSCLADYVDMRNYAQKEILNNECIQCVIEQELLVKDLNKKILLLVIKYSDVFGEPMISNLLTNDEQN